MKIIAKEDLQYIRQRIAEKHGVEMTPDQVLEVLNDVRHIEVENKPGLVSRMREQHGDSGPSRPT